MNLDPRARHSELEVQNFIHLQRIANKLLDAFPDLKRMTRSYMPAECPSSINILVGQSHAKSMIDQSIPNIKTLKKEDEQMIYGGK